MLVTAERGQVVISWKQERGCRFMKKLSRFNTMLLWQQQVLEEDLLLKKLYQELGLEFLQSRHWFRKLCQFYKILKQGTSISF